MPCSARHCLPLLALLLWAASAQAFVYTKPPTTTQCRQVVASGVNIRFAPSLSAATEGEALRKCDRVHYTGVKVTADGLDWAQIKWMGADRYVAAKYLAYCPATACATENAALCSKCLTAKTYLLATPEMAGKDSVASEGAMVAWYESGYTASTNANGDGSTDFGWWQINNRFWCGGSLGGPNTCQASCSTLQYDPKANARCAAKVWKAGPSGGSNYGYWSVAHKFYTRSGCPCGV